MSELEFGIKEVITRLDNTVSNLTTTVNDWKLIMANEYQKKTECALHKNEMQNFKNSMIGWMIGVYSLVVAAIAVFVATK